MSVNNNNNNNNNNSNSNSNSNPPKSLGQSSSPFGNTGMLNPSMPINPAFSQSQSQVQISTGFQGQFQLSQAQATVQAQLKAQQAHVQAQAQAAHAAQIQAARAQFQAQLQAQGMSLSQAQNAALANLGSSSPSFSTPGSLNAKRLPLKPPVRPPAVPMPTMVSPLKTMDLISAARRKKQKLPEKQLQDRMAAILPESALYTQLLEFEAHVDAALSRKKVDIQEALKNPPCVQKTLRIYVFNTFANQIRTIPKKPNAEPPTWMLKIVGRILEDGIDPDQPGVVQKSNPLYPKFSYFFKRVTIMLDQRLYPDNHMIVWEHSRAPATHEGFEVKRRGDKEFTVTIRLEMNYLPEKFKLSPALMEVLGIEVDTRPRIIAAIWHYVKARKLQNPEDPSFFNCDPPLQKVFGEAKMKFTMVSQKISQHLSPPQPIVLEHKIKLSGNSPAGTACYDVVVDAPFPIQRELNALLANAEKNKEIETCDEAICAAIRKVHEHRRRRAFFLGFSQSPVEFINALIESQSRDLNLVAGEASRSVEKERRADFFNQPWVEDAVIRYLNRKPAAGSDAPGSM
ncbi:hypothetical protein P3X46_026459 [Hevea brasiliensis]|uniref:DM2 domain-containing protein n=1 Tax=Hevea brasiliensis TaxID=3981 RepID=A0ABQ9KXM4_HEVBR|nr:SWI/SNF complex component SNF12 homolog [Hevea brasiliensis]XP_021678829.2 SWI/SNF complex component SNF12 homolog [Hevea brasiliensis]KAJ9152955.1 hypothetical protein P3X46_026459 [Hevea brasiliensis]KAJ9152956.1 hypothetical protein P3X46_026459 [Hevea brasiliensis]KAJ9152957.1 hypothetical protein P3X46_026459 [Hevea brasiliensis]